MSPTPRPIPPRSTSLAGSTWVITGTLSKPRPEFESLIKQHGGKTSGNISKKTSYLLAGEEAGSKLDKARDLGVKIIDEAGFFTMIADAGNGKESAAPHPGAESPPSASQPLQGELF